MRQLPEALRFPNPEARIRFGRTLTVWCKRSGWAHDTPAKWGQAAGFPTPKNSTMSLLMRGHLERPTPLTFYQLGLMNDRLARQDLGAITDITLRKRVEAQEPILSPDGRPWTSVDFFAHFMGNLPAPEWVVGSADPTAEDAKRINGEFRASFEETAAERMLSPMEAWNELKLHCTQLSSEQADKLRGVLSGWHSYSIEELVELGDGEPGSRVTRALASWRIAGNPKET